MTTQQLHIFNGLYFAALVVVAFPTRATVLRRTYHAALVIPPVPTLSRRSR